MSPRRLDLRRDARRGPALTAGRAVAGFALTCGVVLGSTFAASADPDAGIPTQADVDAAQSAVDGAAARIAELDATYAQSAVALHGIRLEAARLGEIANGAKWELAQRTRAAQDATRAADAAASEAAKAEVAVRDYAALAYQQGGALGSLEPLFDAAGPQELSDRMSALDFVEEVYAERLQASTLASGTATSLREAAEAARAAQATAAEQAGAAEAAAKAELGRAESEGAKVSGQREILAAELARLRRTSREVERARLDGLAAAAEAEASAPPSVTTSTNPSGTTSTNPSGSSTTSPVTLTLTSTSSSSTTSSPTSSSTSSSATTSSSSTTSHSSTSSSTTRPPTSTSSSSTTPPPTSTSSSSTSSSSTTRPPTTSSTTASSSSTTPTSSTTTPPPASGAAAAIAYAQAQIGKPYEWGADGPDTFDCSGLTMMAWRQAGVYLSHYTGAQYAETARVPIDQLQPGDLVFYGPSGETSTHVGLYVGSGQMIEAPYTGAYVRYASIYRSDLVPYGGRPG